jgi:hypothetical protein
MASIDDVKKLLDGGDVAGARAMLDELGDLEGRARTGDQKRHDARRRAKLEAAHALQRRREHVDTEHHAQDTVWRDGYARGLEHAHAHVMALDPKDPGD